MAEASVSEQMINNSTTLSGTTADKIIAFIQQQIGSIVSGFHEYGPQAVHAIGRVKQIDAISHLFCNCLIFGLLLAGVIMCMRSWNKIGIKITENSKNGIDVDEDGPLFFRCAITLLVTVTIFIIGIYFITEIYNDHTMYLVDAMSPDIAFTHFIMDKAVSIVSGK